MEPLDITGIEIPQDVMILYTARNFFPTGDRTSAAPRSRSSQQPALSHRVTMELGYH